MDVEIKNKISRKNLEEEINTVKNKWNWRENWQKQFEKRQQHRQKQMEVDSKLAETICLNRATLSETNGNREHIGRNSLEKERSTVRNQWKQRVNVHK
jgi:hypothetical protein